MNLNRLTYFTAVVETASFTAAAEQLGVTKAVVSQQVAKLESDVQASLLIRSTRNVRPTEAGYAFYQRCISIISHAEDAFSEMQATSEQPSGVLKLTMPFDYGISVIVPTVAEFSERYPNCKVETLLSDRIVDLMSADFDIAIRVGWLTEEHLQARRIGHFQQRLVASPAWLSQLAKIAHPKELAKHSFIANTALRKPSDWTFALPSGETERVRMSSRISFDATLATKAAAINGLGLAILPDYLVNDDLNTGRLVTVMPEWSLPVGDIFAVFPTAKYRPAKVRAFVDLLISQAYRLPS